MCFLFLSLSFYMFATGLVPEINLMMMVIVPKATRVTAQALYNHRGRKC